MTTIRESRPFNPTVKNVTRLMDGGTGMVYMNIGGELHTVADVTGLLEPDGTISLIIHPRGSDTN